MIFVIFSKKMSFHEQFNESDSEIGVAELPTAEPIITEVRATNKRSLKSWTKPATKKLDY